MPAYAPTSNATYSTPLAKTILPADGNESPAIGDDGGTFLLRPRESPTALGCYCLTQVGRKSLVTCATIWSTMLA